MARQGDKEQLEQSDMYLALNMAQMALGGCLCTAIEEMQSQIRKPHTEVPEERKRGSLFPGHGMLKAAIQSHLVMVCENQMDGSLSCENRTARNMQRRWRCQRTGEPPPEQRRQLTLEPTPPQPVVPAAPLGDNTGAQGFQIEGVPPVFDYIHTTLPNVQFLHLDAYTKDTDRHDDVIPDLLTDNGSSTG